GMGLHSVPPLLVFTAVEGGPAMREALTKAVTRSLTAAGPDTAAPVVNGFVSTLTNPADALHQTDPDSVHEPVHEPVRQQEPESVREPVPAPVREPRAQRSAKGRKPTRAKGSRGGGRVLF